MTADRAQLIAGLRLLADKLDANPNLPAPIDVRIPLIGMSDYDACRMVHRIAATLGVEVQDNGSGVHIVEASIGGVTYHVSAVDRASLRRLDAQMSYWSNLRAGATA